MASIVRKGNINRCLMMKLEEMSPIEAINCKAIIDQFTCNHGNVMLVEWAMERAMDYVIIFFVGQVASDDHFLYLRTIKK